MDKLNLNDKKIQYYHQKIEAENTAHDSGNHKAYKTAQKQSDD